MAFDWCVWRAEVGLEIQDIGHVVVLAWENELPMACIGGLQ